MIEAYKIGLTIALTGDMGVQLARYSDELKGLDIVMKTVLSTTKELSGALRGMKADALSAANAWRQVAAEMTAAARAVNGAVGGGRPGARSVAPGAAGAAPGNYLIPYQRTPSPRYPAPGGDPIRVPGGRSLAPWAGGGPYGSGGSGGGSIMRDGRIPLSYTAEPNGGGGGMRAPGLMGPAIADYGAYEFLKKSTEDAIQLEVVKNRLKQQGFTDAQIERTDKLAFSTQRDVTGSSVLGNANVTAQLMAALQNPEEALTLTPAFAKVSALFNAYAPDGHGSTNADTMDLVRGAELRGELATKNQKTGAYELDPAKLAAFAKAEQSTFLMTEGQIGPKEILAFLKSSGVFGGSMSLESLFGSMPSLMLSVGPSRAKTMVQGLGLQFASGKMSDAAVRLLTDQNVIRGGTDLAKNPYIHKSGIGVYQVDAAGMNPDAFKRINTDPLAFIAQDLYPQMKAYLAKTMGKTYTDADPPTQMAYETSFAAKDASRIPGGKIIGEDIRETYQICRDLDKWRQMQGIDPQKMLEQNPQLAVNAALAAFNASMTSLGQSILPEVTDGLKTITAAMNSLTSWTKENPEATKLGIEAIVTALGGLTGLAVAGKLVKLAEGLNLVGGGFTAALGPLTALGTAAYETGKALDWLQKYLHGIFSWVPEKQMTPAEMVEKWGKDHGIAPGAGGPPIVPDDHKFNFGAPGEEGRDPNFHHSSFVPRGDQSSYAPRGDYGQSGPVQVQLVGSNSVLIANGRDLLRGVAGGIADLSNRPSGGLSGADSRIDASGAFNNRIVSA